jgi:hypothetical protein
MWIVSIILLSFYGGTEIAPFFMGTAQTIPGDQIWQVAASTIFRINLFFPLVEGILAADRLVRDSRGGLIELQRSTPIRTGANVLAKYLGVLLAAILPEFITVAVIALVPVLGGLVSSEYLLASFLSFLAMCVPAMAFVVAYSLACPLVMPVRVYQVLFTGYWFWGNFLSANVFPTISETILNAGGIYSLQGFFGVSFGHAGTIYTSVQAVLNIAVILALAALALTAAITFLNARGKRV